MKKHKSIVGFVMVDGEGPDEEEIRGTITYNEATKKSVVECPDDPRMEVLLGTYLETERRFDIPIPREKESDTDQYRIDNVKPNESLMYWELSLCTAYTQFDAYIEWEGQRTKTIGKKKA